MEQLELDFDFIPKEAEEAPEVEAPSREETITVGATKVVFREPTEEELPTRPRPREDTGFIGQDFFSNDGEWVATSVGQSPAGNALRVVKRRDGGGYELSWTSGELPNHLRGWFTTFDKAEAAARVYLAGLWDEARKKAS